MDKIVLTSTPYDGEYDLDSGEPFSILEWRWIKRISGYMPNTVNDGLSGQDPDLFLALAMVALVRNGKIQREHVFAVADLIAEIPYTSGTILYREEVEEADPPAETQKQSPDDDESENGSSDTSGDDSTESSARSGNGQPPTGLPLSAIRAMSGSTT